MSDNQILALISSNERLHAANQYFRADRDRLREHNNRLRVENERLRERVLELMKSSIKEEKKEI